MSRVWQIRFSLRTLFVAFTLVCVLTFVLMSRPVQQKRVVDRVETLVARATRGRDRHMPAIGYRHQVKRTSSNEGSGRWLREWFGSEYFGELDTLQLDDTPTGDDDLTLLADLPDLNFLRLANTKVTDRGMGDLAECRELEFLSLESTSVTHEGLSALVRLPKLRALSLKGMNISDESIPTLLKFSKLRSLNLHDTLITKAGYERLVEGLPECNIMTPSLRGYSLEIQGMEFRYLSSGHRAMLERTRFKKGRVVNY